MRRAYKDRQKRAHLGTGIQKELLPVAEKKKYLPDCLLRIIEKIPLEKEVKNLVLLVKIKNEPQGQSLPQPHLFNSLKTFQKPQKRIQTVSSFFKHFCQNRIAKTKKVKNKNGE